MKKTQEHKLELTVGLFLAGVHAFWSLAIAAAPRATKQALDWILSLHHINSVYALAPFHLLNAILLIALTFTTGYAIGWALGAIHQRVQ